MEPTLGSLRQAELRDIWGNESNSFTPWLAGHLEELGAALGLELELVGTEVPVGPFYADVLAKDTGTDRYVIIENQLERTNHDHLGKIITYGAILDASVVVWIARTFTDEHRKALDWLNDRTDENLEFYGICIELWRIGDSPPAPRFSVISRPSGVVKQARSAGVSEETSDRRKLQFEFWTAFRDVMREAKAVPSLQTPRPQYWYDLSIGRSHFHISCVADTGAKRIGVRLYMGHGVAGAALALFAKDRGEIERAVGSKVEWNPNPDNRDKIIRVDRSADLSRRDAWPEYLEWMKVTVMAFRIAFRERILALDLSEGGAVAEGSEAECP